jgi:hypothetical protein
MAITLLCQIAEGGGIAENVNVSAWGGTATTLGQKLKAASVPVTFASDQYAAANAVVSITTAAGAGATTAGIRSLSIANVGGASGTVDGDTFQAGSTLELTAIWDPVTQTFLKVPAISYDATGTSYRIVEVA